VNGGERECRHRHGDGVTSTVTDAGDADDDVVAGAVVEVGTVVGAVVGTVVGTVVGAVVGGGVGSVVGVGAGVVVGADVDVDSDGGEDVEVDGAAVVPPGRGLVVLPSVPLEVVGLDEPAVVPATWAMTSATVDVGPGAGTVPADPASPDDAGPLVAGPVLPRVESTVESGVESWARATGGATHGRRSPGRTGPPRRPMARTAT
jgi:hypothetical protein